MARLLPFRRRTAPPADGALDVDALYRQYAGMVLRRARRFFANPAEAEEVTHEVFLRVIERQASFRAEASPSTWLYRVTTNLCLNKLRDRGRRQAALDLNADLPWLLPSGPADQETLMFLERLWHELDDEALSIGVAYFVDGMTHDEIARVQGVSRRTIGNRIDDLRHRARTLAGIAE
ncbi:MAG: sigma-70 family RNA polymerase sigma factor [Myxococcales bacterium]|nr:sigma-70 family RNA polymerase sigma factor [Myxococcales bacterium]